MSASLDGRGNRHVHLDEAAGQDIPIRWHFRGPLRDLGGLLDCRVWGMRVSRGATPHGKFNGGRRDANEELSDVGATLSPKSVA